MITVDPPLTSIYFLLFSPAYTVILVENYPGGLKTHGDNYPHALPMQRTTNTMHFCPRGDLYLFLWFYI